MRDLAVSGATSNPTIFAKAITGSDRYNDQLRGGGVGSARSPRLFFALAFDDVCRVTDPPEDAGESTHGSGAIAPKARRSMLLANSGVSSWLCAALN